MAAFSVTSPEGAVRVEWSYDGDYYVGIAVEVHGFRGHADGHVARQSFIQFAESVQEFSMSRRGTVGFRSVIPGLFDLRLVSISSLGHLGIEGALNHESNQYEKQRLKFSLKFEPGQIEEVARVLHEVDA